MLRSVSPERGVPSLEWHDAQVAPLPLPPSADDAAPLKYWMLSAGAGGDGEEPETR